MSENVNNPPESENGVNDTKSDIKAMGDAGTPPSMPGFDGLDDDFPVRGFPLSMGQFSEPVAEGTTATVGHPLAQGVQMASEATVIDTLKTVFDPEIPVNIYDLGLIYACDLDEDGNVDIIMTLTTPNCPVAADMPQLVAGTVGATTGVGVVSVKITWEPPWHQGLMSEDASLALGLF